ncbi:MULTISPECIES: DUF924 family protein [Halomonadaceae]|uniref:DUF924 family protein n=1 Tax=Halomonadaceae TaxID=28256 RepID=UPI001599C758|nr:MULTISPECIES: DUF924 family protein [Halomonas]QJQ95766.1 DUF924 domain-containing protein [Halomonas sp. PA5]
MPLPEVQEVLSFWFDELEPRRWFVKEDALDREIRSRFGELLVAAARGELWRWRLSARGRLAEILVLDQFSRNAYRDTPAAFAQDAQALALSQEAVAHQVDRHLSIVQKPFLYMPYMHSESLLIHDEALRLFDQPGLEENLHYEQRHREIIARFGRYPHRNGILGRDTTAEEREFLQEPGSSF